MKAGWRRLLEPFALQYADFDRFVENRVEGMSGDDLTALLAATSLPHSADCWWAIYAVRHVVRDEVKRELFKRRRAAAEKAP